MPSPSKRRNNMCFVGDSQLGALRIAMRDGLTHAPKGVDVEFWGASGPQFRQIHWDGDAIRASGDALEMVQQINANGRGHIAATDFDTVVFYGARLRAAEFFGPYLDWVHRHDGFPSAAVMKATAKGFVRETRAYRMAHELAEAGCQVIYVPGAFYTADILDLTEKNSFLDHYPGAVHGTAQMRDTLWSVLEDVSADLGITMIRQPEDTVTQGALTQAEFACKDALEHGDISHKSPAFAARWMQEVWPHLKQKAKAA